MHEQLKEEEAMSVLKEGLAIEPENESLATFLKQV